MFPSVRMSEDAAPEKRPCHGEHGAPKENLHSDSHGEWCLSHHACTSEQGCQRNLEEESLLIMSQDLF